MNMIVPDPFDVDPPHEPQPFAIGYQKNIGDLMVHGGLLIAAVLAIAGIVSGMRLLTFGAFFPLVVALWHYPAVDRRHPQLGANKDGVFVERIGFINWAAIKAFRQARTSVRNIEIIYLEIVLNSPLDQAVAKRQKIPFWKAPMLRNWRYFPDVDGETVLRVRLDTLNGPADKVMSSLRSYRNV